MFSTIQTWILSRNSGSNKPLYDFTIERDWNLLCPNVKELHARVNEPSLTYILGRMINLEKLCLPILINAPSRTVNSVLSRLPNPGRACRGTPESIQKLRESSGYPSLLNLTSTFSFRKFLLNFEIYLVDCEIDS